MLKRCWTCRFTEDINRIDRLQSVRSHGLDDAAHQAFGCGGNVVESVEVFLHVEDVVATDGKDGVDVGSNHLLAVDFGLADPASASSNVGSGDQIGVGLESAGDAVHEVSLVELGEHG